MFVLEKHKEYRVVRKDGTFIVGFDSINEAVNFSDKLNICYKRNGIKDLSKVIKTNLS